MKKKSKLDYGWYAYIVNKESKLDVNNTNITFPVIWKKITAHYTEESLILGEDILKIYINNEKELDKISINEITGYYINIEKIENNSDELFDNINTFFTSLIDNYDNINKKYPFHRTGAHLLEIYI